MCVRCAGQILGCIIELLDSRRPIAIMMWFLMKVQKGFGPRNINLHRLV